MITDITIRDGFLFIEAEQPSITPYQNVTYCKSYTVTPEAFDKLAIALCERYEQIKNDAQKGYGEE